MTPIKRALAAVCAAVVAATGAVAVAQPAAAVPDTIPLTITNDSGRAGPVYLYVLGEDLQTGQMGWADASGSFHAWPHTGPQPIPAPDASIVGPTDGQSLTIQMPKLSGRVYFSYGQKLTFQVVNDGRLVQPAVQNPSDPNRDVLFNWTEYTLNDGGLWINSTQVDFFSAPYQVGVRETGGTVRSTGMLRPDGFEAFFDAIGAQPGWGDLVQRAPDGSVLRGLAPSHGLGVGLLDPNVLDDYVNRVWDHYRANTLTVTPFSHEPQTQFFGRVTGDRMHFTDTSGQEVASFPRPSTDSIFGCHDDLHAPNDHVVGPIARTLCAGFNRTTLLTNPNQPDTDASGFYQDAVTNHYAREVHAQMANGKAYAFAFDDVGAHESLVHDGNPTAAYISLDPFVGAATPIGESSGGEPGGPGGPGDPGGPTDPGTGLPVGTGTILASNGLCLDVPWAETHNGNPAQIAHCNGGAAQQWARGADGTVRALGKCLDVAGSGTSNGTVVQLWDCNGTGAQTWTYDAGSAELRNPQSGKCLDARGGTPLHDGQRLTIWDCHGGDNQRWTL